jgi:hypothetical protein
MAPSIWMLLYRLFRPATVTMVSSSLSPTAVKNGDSRANSWKLRSRLGRSSIACSETLVVTPWRSGVISGLTSAVTVSSSSIVASCSVKSTDTVSPNCTKTLSTCEGLNPSSSAVTEYGPPTRTLRIRQRPSAWLTVE